MPHSVQALGRSSWPYGSSRPSERALDPECEPPLGAHMVTPRLGYTHHGIYAGRGRVVQYGGLSHGLRRGPVEEVSLVEFCQGHPIRIRVQESCWRDAQEVVRRARLRLGENRYHPLRNNCEHFCEWCVRGEHRSYQVDELFGLCSRTWRRVVQTLARLICYATEHTPHPPNVMLRNLAGGSICDPPVFSIRELLNVRSTLRRGSSRSSCRKRFVRPSDRSANPFADSPL